MARSIALLLAGIALVACSSAKCHINGDCSFQEVCLDGRCSQPPIVDSGVIAFVDSGFMSCSMDTDCPTGEGCQGGSCAAAPVDAGSPDAGGPLDAGVADAGPADSGSPVVDAGPPDAGSTDAGPVSCAAASDCQQGESCLNSVCIPTPTICMSDADCASTPATPHCNTVTDACTVAPIACSASTDCPLGDLCYTSVCKNLTSGTCTTDSDCSANASYPLCETAVHECVSCLDGSTPDAVALLCGQDSVCSNDVCLFGCSELITCLNNCTEGPMCTPACDALTSPNGRTVFSELYSCIAADCPDTAGGVCDSTSATYIAANCSTCTQNSQLSDCEPYVQLCDAN